MRRMASGSYAPEYIEFADSAVEAICAANWGDGVGLTYDQAAAVTSLGYVFKGNTNIVSFDELQYFTNLTEITGNTNSAYAAFCGCTNLVSVVLPNSCVSIGRHAFDGCTSLEECSGGNVTSFGAYCFNGCTSLVDIDLSHAVTIETYAFAAANLSSIALNMPNLTSLGSYAFMSTAISSITSLGSITTIPDGNTSQGKGVFSSCTSLTSATLPNTLTYIGHSAFQSCSLLSSINIPSSVTAIGGLAFRQCSLAGILNIPQNITLNSATFLGNQFTKIIFGGDVAGLAGSLNGWLATLFCDTLLEIEFSANQTSSIGGYIVKNPSVYSACPLTTIILRSTTPPVVNSYTFNGMGSLAHIYVPASAVDTYKADSIWGTKSSLIEAIPS